MNGLNLSRVPATFYDLRYSHSFNQLKPGRYYSTWSMRSEPHGREE